MIQIVKANKGDKDTRTNMSKLFVYSFYNMFKRFCKDKEKLSKAFRHIFDMNSFYIVLLDKEIIGIGAISDGKAPVKLNKRKLCFHLGIRCGKKIYDYLNKVIVRREYNFEMDKNCGMLEFVCVKEPYKGKKVGFTLINHIIHDNKYIRYLVKVANNNYRAKRLFENIGFEEFDDEQATIMEKEDMGVDNYLYMIYQKN